MGSTGRGSFVPKDNNWNADGPYIVWRDYGCEGWSPRSYDTAAAALADKDSGSVITRVVEFTERPEKD